MAYLIDYTYDKLNQPQTGNAPTTGGPSTLSASQAGESKKTNSGTGWTNLQNYLNANQGAGDQIGEKIGGQFQNTLNTANKEVDDTNKAVAAGSNYQTSDLDILYNWDPVKTSQAQFDAYRNVDYTGPQQFTGTQGQKLTDMTTGAQTTEGRKGLIRDAYGRDNYSSGEQNFDNLLLQGSSKGMDTLGGFKGKTDQYNANVGQVGQNIQNAKTNAGYARAGREMAINAAWTSAGGDRAGQGGTKDWLYDRAKIEALDALMKGTKV